MIDVHIAAEPANNPACTDALVALGFSHDTLLARHVTFYQGMPLTSCPLIGLHMTKKYDLAPARARELALADMQAACQIMRTAGLKGYAHAETVPAGHDLTIASDKPFAPLPWPVEAFTPSFSDRAKLWDIHIAIPIETMPPALVAIMTASGMYSIDVAKIRQGRQLVFRVFTIQGLSSPLEGKRLFQVLSRWFSQSQAPYVEIKQESYLGMERIGNPKIVPPTIDQVRYLAPLAAVA